MDIFCESGGLPRGECGNAAMGDSLVLAELSAGSTSAGSSCGTPQETGVRAVRAVRAFGRSVSGSNGSAVPRGSVSEGSGWICARFRLIWLSLVLMLYDRGPSGPMTCPGIHALVVEVWWLHINMATRLKVLQWLTSSFVICKFLLQFAMSVVIYNTVPWRCPGFQACWGLRKICAEIASK